MLWRVNATPRGVINCSHSWFLRTWPRRREKTWSLTRESFCAPDYLSIPLLDPAGITDFHLASEQVGYEVAPPLLMSMRTRRHEPHTRNHKHRRSQREYGLRYHREKARASNLKRWLKLGKESRTQIKRRARGGISDITIAHYDLLVTGYAFSAIQNYVRLSLGI